MMNPAIATAVLQPSEDCGDALMLDLTWQHGECLLHSQSRRMGIQSRVILINLVFIIYH